MKAASWDIRSVMRSARCWTIPNLIVACVVGDGEAETGPLATAWHSNKFLHPVNDGAVLPILHLNGYKIANPTVLARIGRDELEQLLSGYGWTPLFVEGDDPEAMHQLDGGVLDEVMRVIGRIRSEALANGPIERPRWPMIVLRTPKGWTGPKFVDGLPVEGSFRSHQVPIVRSGDESGAFAAVGGVDEELCGRRNFLMPGGALLPELAELAPAGDRRMGANPNANGGLLLKDLRMPDFRAFAVRVDEPGKADASDTTVLGRMLAEVIRLNADRRNFRLSARMRRCRIKLDAMFQATNRQWEAEPAGDGPVAGDMTAG